MFTRIDKTGVRSSDGFEVQRVARFTIEYREGSKVMSIYVDGDLFFYTTGPFAKWDPPYDKAFISKVERQKIRDRVNAALEALNE